MVEPPRTDARQEAPSRRGFTARRLRVVRFNQFVMRRLNMAGLLALTAGVCAVDFVMADHAIVAPLATIAQALLALPWAWTILRLDAEERRLSRQERVRRLRLVGVHVASLGLLIVALAAKGFLLWEAWPAVARSADAYRIHVVAVYVAFALGLIGRGSRAGRLLATVADHPARLMAMSFGGVALLGAFLLTLPVSLRDPARASFVDAVFTATSAVCVTGLSVHDLSSTYGTFGQVVIFALIQAGGLGIMVLSASFAILAGRRLRVRSSAVLAQMIDAESLTALRRTVRQIVLYTLFVETIGAVALYAAFAAHPEVELGPQSPHPAAGPGGLAWAAAFHSVSAFCNAGFSLCRGNLTAFSGAAPVLLVISTLIVLGGIGFPVLAEAVEQVRGRLRGERQPRLSLHFRVTVYVSAVLTIGGAAVILLLEGDRETGGSAGRRALDALFQSVSARTAGFNSVDIGAMSAATLVFVSALMFVGASSGSTGGGIKTSTLAALLATFRAELRGEAEARLFDRRIPATLVRRAVAVAVVSFAVVTLVFFVLLLTEDHEPLRVLFETVSAFSTCGLSTGITSMLSDAGKLVVTAAMFVGRIGPLTLALAVVAAPRRARYEVPEGRLMIG